MKDIMELIRMLVAGTLNVTVDLTITGTINVTDPDGNYWIFTVPPVDPAAPAP